MKKLILLAVVAVWSTGCSNLTYDALQYDRFISLQEQLELLRPQCGSANFKDRVAQLKVNTDHMERYAIHRIAAPEVAKATSTVASMVNELNAQYQGTNTASDAYCKLKIDNISAGVTTIISGLGAQ